MKYIRRPRWNVFYTGILFPNLIFKKDEYKSIQMRTNYFGVRKHTLEKWIRAIRANGAFTPNLLLMHYN